jgi:release factor glutamine methyltransferase
VLETIQRGSEFLTRKNVDAPRLQSELLLAHVLRVPRMRLYLEFDRVLEEDQLVAVRELIKRRGAREPLQQIVGSTTFCGLEIAVNRHALIPRPETELLAERGWKFLCEWAAHHAGSPLRALDFGTGSGCLALALASHCVAAEIDALDSSAEALDLARQNATAHGLQNRIRFFHGRRIEDLPAGTRYSLIISNPPYIPSADIELLEPEVRDFEPRQALDGGVDGLDLYRRLAGEAGPLLSPGGCLMVEFGDGQSSAVTRLLAEQNWIVAAVEQDYTARPRFLVARRD